MPTSLDVKLPIGVIGAGNPTSEQYQMAEALGKALAKLGLVVLCGGKAGVMEAVCKGVHAEGGTSIGLLPEMDTLSANAFVTIPIATGIGVARNAIIAAGSLCLIAVGGGYGTLSEIAYGLQFGKKVFAINSQWKVEGLVYCETLDELIKQVCEVALKSPPTN